MIYGCDEDSTVKIHTRKTNSKFKCDILFFINAKLCTDNTIISFKQLKNCLILVGSNLTNLLHLNRWAFNPFRNECVKFIYSGCGENQNNFSEKLRCEQSCMNPPIFGCEMDPGIYDTGFQSRKCN